MNMNIQAIEKWIENHPYLSEIGALPLAIEKALDSKDVIKDIPNLDSVAEKFLSGTPLLHLGIDFNIYKIAGNLFLGLSTIAEDKSLPEKVTSGVKNISRLNSSEAESLVEAVLKGDENLVKDTASKLEMELDFILYLVWNTIRISLRDIKEKLEEWIYANKWQENICPVCGNKPSSALLKRTKRGREKFLHCDHCGTDWGYKRMGCPYCDNIDQKTLSIKDSEDEPDIRLDLCHKCNTYIKTYIGDSKYTAGTSDWAAIHMDLLMKDSGFSKKGGLIKAE